VFIAKSLVLRKLAFVRYFDEVDDSVRTKLIFAEKLKRNYEENFTAKNLVDARNLNS
jgi:hypothetical protein